MLGPLGSIDDEDDTGATSEPTREPPVSEKSQGSGGVGTRAVVAWVHLCCPCGWRQRRILAHWL